MVICLVDFNKLSGKFVICAGGFDLGDVNGIEMNTDTWQVTHLHVRLSKQASEDLGFKTRFTSKTVCLPTSLVSKVGDNILLNKSLEELTKHPEIYECREL
jgi:sporulation protein YlmC with PRC-barrel domain